MGAPDILSRLQSLGLTLSADGDRLLAEPKAALTDVARTLIRQHKPELLALLKVSSAITARGWLVRYPDGGVIETYVILADGAYPTRAEVLRDYPGSTGADPIAEL